MTRTRNKVLTTLLVAVLFVCLATLAYFALPARGVNAADNNDGGITTTDTSTESGGSDISQSVASVGTNTNSYDTLASAVAAAQNNEVVTLLADTNECITVAAGQTITLDLNGFVLTGEGADTIVNNGTLTVVDGSEAKSGAVDNLSHAKAALVNHGTAVLSGGTFKRSQEAGTDPDNNGGNSYYVIDSNSGTGSTVSSITINEGVTVYHGASADVAGNYKYSSLMRNGGEKAYLPGDIMIINGGDFYTGLNTVKNDDEEGVLDINGGNFHSATRAVLNWGHTTIDGGVFDGEVVSWFGDKYGATADTVSMAITSGTFLGKVASEDYDKADAGQEATLDYGTTISGGSFSEAINSAYVPADKVLYPTDDGFAVNTFETAVAQGNGIAQIGNVLYDSLAKAVDAVEPGQAQPTVITIVGEGDIISGPGVKVNGQNIIIDLNGKTYNVINPTVGSQGTETNAFQMLAGSTVVFRNGALTSDVAIILLQNYCDLTLEDVIIDATDSASIWYLASNNNGSFTAKGNTQLIAGEGQVAFDVYYNLGGGYPDGVTVNFGEDFAGKVVGKVEYGVAVATENWQSKTQLNIQNGEFDISIAPSGTSAADANINISGGTFSQIADYNYYADGYVWSDNGDGTYGVQQGGPYLAAIGTVGYESLADAIAAAQDGETVTLIADITLSERIYVYNDIILDLDGHTLTIGSGLGSICAIAVDSNGTDVGRLVIDGNGVIDAQNADDLTVPVGAWNAGTEVVMQSGKIIVNTGKESCLYSYRGGKVIINGGILENIYEGEYAYGGGAPLVVNVHNGTSQPTDLVINGGTFIGRNPALGDDNNGGTFISDQVKLAQQPDGTYIAYDKETEVTGADAVYYVEDGVVVAEVYTADALTEAVAQDTYGIVRLGADIASDITVAAGRTVTIDLGGNTLSGKIINNGTMSVMGGTVSASGGNAIKNSADAVIQSIADCTLQNDSSTYAVIQNYGTITEIANCAINVQGGGWLSTGKGIANSGTIEAIRGGSIAPSDTGEIIAIALNNGTIGIVENAAVTGDIDLNSVDVVSSITISGGSVTGDISFDEESTISLAPYQGQMPALSTQTVTGYTPEQLEAFASYADIHRTIQANDAQDVIEWVKSEYAYIDEIMISHTPESVALTQPLVISRDLTISVMGGNHSVDSPLAIEGGVIVDGANVTIYDIFFAGDGSGTAITVRGGGSATYTRSDLTQIDIGVSGYQIGVDVEQGSSATLGNIVFSDITDKGIYAAGTVTLSDCVFEDAAITRVVYTAEELTAAMSDSLCSEVVLGADITANITNAAQKTVTLDLNGKTLTAGSGHGVTNYGVMTIKDSVGGGKIYRPDGDTQGYMIVNNDSGVMVLDNITVINEDKTDPSSLVANSQGNSSQSNPATMTITGGLYDCYNANAVKNNDYGRLIIEDGTFISRCDSTVGGVSQAVQNWGYAEIHGGTYEGVYIAVSGNAYGGQVSNTIIYDGIFTATDAASGRAIQITTGDGGNDPGDPNVDIKGGTFNGKWAVVCAQVTGCAIDSGDGLVVTGGTFNGDVVLMPEMQISLNGGTYEGVVSAQGKTGFITNGKYAVAPADTAFADNYTGELYNGYYVVVEETTADTAALINAQIAAQADIRNYLAANGMTLAEIKALAADNEIASGIVAAYDALGSTTSVSGTSLAALRIIDDIDSLVANIEATLDAYKAEKIDALAILAGQQVTVPTYAIEAINNADTQAEVDAYYNSAVAEINAAIAGAQDEGTQTPPAAQPEKVNLTGVYVMLGVILIVAVAALMVALLMKQKKDEKAAEKPEGPSAPPTAPLDTKLSEVKQEVMAQEAAATATAAAASDDIDVDDGDKEQIVIAANVRSFDEAYDELDDEQKKLFNAVKDYALSKEGAAEAQLSSGICVKKGSKQIVKLTVRRGNPVALFVLENEMLKDFRRNNDSPIKLKVRATELVLREEGDLEAARTMVDLSVDQIDKDVESAKERRREARRQRRMQKKAQEQQQDK